MVRSAAGTLTLLFALLLVPSDSAATCYMCMPDWEVEWWEDCWPDLGWSRWCASTAGACTEGGNCGWGALTPSLDGTVIGLPHAAGTRVALREGVDITQGCNGLVVGVKYSPESGDRVRAATQTMSL